jgi:hypothetical protein
MAVRARTIPKIVVRYTTSGTALLVALLVLMNCTHRLLPYLPKEGEAIRAIALRLGLGFFIGSIIVDCGRSEEEAE